MIIETIETQKVLINTMWFMIYKYLPNIWATSIYSKIDLKLDTNKFSFNNYSNLNFLKTLLAF